MSAFLSAKFSKYGLIDDDDSPSTRVFVKDVHTDTEASIRQVPERDTDTDGAPIFAGFRSEVNLAAADVSGADQAETWMSDFSDVELVGLTPDHLVQWYNPSRLTAREQLETTESNLAESMVQMVQDGGDQQTHDVYVTRNGLLHLAPQNGGWADTDNDNIPDGYTATNLKSADFSGGTFSAFVDTANNSYGELRATIPFPLDGVDVTFSVDVNQLHDDGSNSIRIEALADNVAGVIASSTTSVSSTGRKSVTLTTPTVAGSGATYYLRVHPVRVESATTETTKIDIQDPCLRVDGGTSYVQK